MAGRRSWYQERIAALRPDVNPRFAEAYMRIEHGTLDRLSSEAFEESLEIAVECVLNATAEMSERLARSYGL